MKTSEASGFLIFYNFHVTSKGKIALKWVNLKHCVKRVRIRRYSGPHFSCIRTEYGVTLRISPYSVRMRENVGKMRTRITQNTDTFYAVKEQVFTLYILLLYL